jgi:acetyl-CoA acetyltransferase
MPARSPIQDKVAIVGVGMTEYGRSLPRTSRSLALEAAKKAIFDAGVTKEDIDGLCVGGLMLPWRSEVYFANLQTTAIQESLGIREITWALPSRFSAVYHAVHAVFSGACDTALIVQVGTRMPSNSNSVGSDPYKQRMADMGRGFANLSPLEGVTEDYANRWGGGGSGMEPYAAWAGRYLHDYGVPRDVFGLIAINHRTNATMNENALMRTPLTMRDYLSARMVREPLSILDCDLPVDCAEAIVVTTAERAKDLAQKPVFIHSTAMGQSDAFYEAPANQRDWTSSAPWVAMKELWRNSDLGIQDMDLFFPYDGFTPMAICWTEAAGYGGPGQSWDFLRANWSENENRLRIGGRTIVSPDGGGLSHGRNIGFTFFVESVLQLRGQAGVRQVLGAKTSLVGIGSLYHDAIAAVLRAD